MILRDQSIDLLTQDMIRPVLGGYEFMRLLKADPRLRLIPVLIISGSPEVQTAMMFKETGIDFGQDVAGYVEKGKNSLPAVLISAVETIISKHGRANG